MRLLDYVRVADDAIPHALCDSLIERFEGSNAVIEGKVGTEHGPQLTDVRSCLEINVTKQPDWLDLQDALTRQLLLTVQKYREDIKGYVFPEQFGCEQFRMKKYRSTPGFHDHFSHHVDVNNYASARRFLVCFWYLNDVSEGGETVFSHLGLRVHPKKGRVLIFPPLWMYPHSGERPISNAKYIVGSYLHLL